MLFLQKIDEECLMYSKSDNLEIMINDEANNVIKELFESLKKIHQNNLELMKSIEISFDYVHSLYYECHKTNLNCGRSYIESPYWIKSKKEAINHIDKKYNKCF